MKDKKQLKKSKIPRYKLSLDLGDILTAFRGFIYSNKNNILKFEEEFKKYMDMKESIAVSRARIGEYLILKNLNLRKNSEVIVCPYTVPDVINMIICVGLKPVFADIDEKTFNFDLNDLKKKITKKTKAIIITHLSGYVENMDKIQKIAQKHKIIIIEDCAQACGAKFKNKKAGSFGYANYFSFGTYKNLNTFGGGMITTNDTEFANKIRKDLKKFKKTPKTYLIKKIIKDSALWFASTRFIFNILTFNILRVVGQKFLDGFLNSSTNQILFKKAPENYKIKYTNLQAKVGLKQLRKLDKRNMGRIKNASILNKNFNKKIPKTNYNTYLNYPFITPKRYEIQEKLFKHGIDTTCGNIVPCNTLNIFKDYYVKCKNAEHMYNNVIYFPIQPPINPKIIKGVIKIVNNT